jgi:hypothetical protein
VTRTGAPSGSATSDTCKNGSQNLRTSSPHGSSPPHACQSLIFFGGKHDSSP